MGRISKTLGPWGFLGLLFLLICLGYLVTVGLYSVGRRQTSPAGSPKWPREVRGGIRVSPFPFIVRNGVHRSAHRPLGHGGGVGGRQLSTLKGVRVAHGEEVIDDPSTTPIGRTATMTSLPCGNLVRRRLGGTRRSSASTRASSWRRRGELNDGNWDPNNGNQIASGHIVSAEVNPVVDSRWPIILPPRFDGSVDGRSTAVAPRFGINSGGNGDMGLGLFLRRRFPATALT